MASIVLCAHIAHHAPVAPFTWVAQLNPFCAVMLFLTISGFSIRHSVTTKPQGFLKRRFWRIYPVYAAAFLLSLVPLVVWALYPHLNAPADLPTPRQFFANLFMLQGLVEPAFATNMAAWSLAVEELFYLSTPLLTRLPRRYVWLLLAGSAATFAHTPELVYSHHVGFIIPAALAWAWLLGWQLHGARECKWTQGLVIGLPLVLIASHGQSSLGSPGLLLLACGLLIVHQNELKLPERWQRVASYAGDISYPLYIVHFPVLSFLLLFGALQPWVGFALSLLVSVIIYHAVDLPCRRRSKREQAITGHISPADKPLPVSDPRLLALH